MKERVGIAFNLEAGFRHANSSLGLEKREGWELPRRELLAHAPHTKYLGRHRGTPTHKVVSLEQPHYGMFVPIFRYLG